MSPRPIRPIEDLLGLTVAALVAATACTGPQAALPQFHTADELAPDLPAPLPGAEGVPAEADGPGITDIRAGGPTLADVGRNFPTPTPAGPIERPEIARAPAQANPPVDTSAPPEVPGLEAGDACTYTAASFGAPCLTNTADVGCIVQRNFGALFGEDGLRIGSAKSVRFTSAEALRAAMPGAGVPEVLSSDVVDPARTTFNAFASEVTALALNIALSEQGLAGSLPLADVHVAHGPLAGLSVGAVFEMSEALLGGEQNTLSALGYGPESLTPILAGLNRAGLDCAATVLLAR